MPAHICEQCTIKCDGSCKALEMLYHFYGEERQQARGIELINLAELLSLWDAYPDKDMETLGNQIINKFDHLHFILDLDIKIGYCRCTQPKQEKGERILGECIKVKPYQKAWLPFDFIVVFYDLNIDYLDENQIKIIMLHELQHIEVGPKGLKIREHDVKDFSNIITKHSLNWSNYDTQVKDILEGDTDE